MAYSKSHHSPVREIVRHGALVPYANAFTDWLACAVEGARQLPFTCTRDGSILSETFRLATAGHYVDFDDTHLPSMCHLSASTAPAALATGVHTGATVGEVLCAYATAFESMACFGRATNPRMYELGWHSTAVCGVIGASIATAWFLAPENLDDAAALSLTGAAGTLSSFGTDAKSLQVGLSAMTGVGAALATAGGARGEKSVYDAGQGFSAAYLSGDPIQFDDDTAIELNWVKAYPCCLQTHTTVEAALILCERGWSAEDSGPLRLRISPLGRKAANQSLPVTPLQAKFSPQYVAAMTLLDGKPTVQDFEVVDDRVLQLAKAIELVVDESLTEPCIVLEPVPGEQQSSIEFRSPPGSPENPLSEEALEEKWAALAGFGLRSVIHDLDAPATSLLELLRPEKGTRI